jgi:hypothetical protein
MAKALSEAKENSWMDISKSMAKIWPFINIVFEQHELVEKAREAIGNIRQELGEKPT